MEGWVFTLSYFLASDLPTFQQPDRIRNRKPVKRSFL